MLEEPPSAGQDRRSMADVVLSVDSSLLTPPLSIDTDERPPFKPLDSDNVSLSMKRSGKSARQPRRLNRACVSSGDVNDIHKESHPAEHSLSRKSLPDLGQHKRSYAHPLLSEPGNRAWVDQKLEQWSSQQAMATPKTILSDSRQTSGVHHRPRRWTVPTKARPTHRVCFTNHTKPTATVDKTSGEPPRVTPAMIVLRRATSKKQRVQPVPETNITFFPPPKFNRTSTTLLSFLRVTSQQSRDGNSGVTTNASMTHNPGLSNTSSPPRRPSVTKECARPCCSIAAEPAVTDVMVYSSPEPDTPQPFDEPGRRRFSTKIISDISVHEIIWDENVISGESASSGSDISHQPATRYQRSAPSPPRKKSIAVEKLELQLRKDDSGPRRTSSGSVSGPRRTSSGSVSEPRRTQRNSLQSLLNFKFGEAEARTEDLRGLPRSRAAKDLPHNLRREMQEEDARLRDHIEFFPPIRYRTPATSQEHITVCEQNSQPEGKAHAYRKSSSGPMGRSLGQSRHRRRKSTALYYHHTEKRTSIMGPSDERMPLLSQTGLDGVLPYAETACQGLAVSYQQISAVELDPAHGLDRSCRSGMSQYHLRRCCEICKFGNHKKLAPEVKSEIKALGGTISTTTTRQTRLANLIDGTGVDGTIDERAEIQCPPGFEEVCSASPGISERGEESRLHVRWPWVTTQKRNFLRHDAAREACIFSRLAALENKVEALEKAVATMKHAKVKTSAEVDSAGVAGPKEYVEVQESTELCQEEVADQTARLPVGKATDGPQEGEQ